jgi:hypothetical protein
VLFCGISAVAQNSDYPKWDFTAGYTLNHFETPAPRRHITMQGFTGAVGWNFRRWAALEGDFTYTTKNLNGTRRTLYSYIAGPRFTKRFNNHSVQPFVHALFGGGHLSGFGSSNGWVGKMGGGVDFVVSDHVAIRAFQVDYYRYHGNVPVGQQRLNNMAATFGIRLF